MAKRELIDRTHLLEDIKKLQKSPWYNRGKNGMALERALYFERKEAVEVVRDLCINDEPVITEQEIIKSILEKLKVDISKTHIVGYATINGKIEIAHRAITQIIDKYITESEDKDGNNN